MTDTTHIDRIISDVNNLEEQEKIIFFRKIDEIFFENNAPHNNDIPIESVFGLWKNRNITDKTLREKAWKKN